MSKLWVAQGVLIMLAGASLTAAGVVLSNPNGIVLGAVSLGIGAYGLISNRFRR